MLASGASLLSGGFSEIGALNVFPVSDGNTGTNMSLTFNTGVQDALACPNDDVCGVTKVLSRGLLMGARGNSGAITSQTFRDLYQGVEGMKEVNGFQLTNALVQGLRVAYKAVMRPVEGTILTVVHEAADYAYACTTSTQDVTVTQVMKKMVEGSKKSLIRTPGLLPVLKEIGVVDSGGVSLMTIFEGFLSAIKGTIIQKGETGKAIEGVQASMESKELGYRTEFIIHLSECSMKSFREDSPRDSLVDIGNSIVCVQDDDIIKVHVHTLTPGDALNMGQRYSEFVRLKVEDMQEQHKNTMMNVAVEEKETPQQPKNKYTVITIAAGDGLKDMLTELRAGYVIGGEQTMSPSTEDFVQTIDKVNVGHIFILPNNSNIVLAARQAASVCEGQHVEVIPTRTIPQGLSTYIMFSPGVDFDMSLSEMSDAIALVKTGQVTYAVKDTTFEDMEIREDDRVGILEKDIIVSNLGRLDTTRHLIDAMVDGENEVVILIRGEDITEEEAQGIASYIEGRYDVEVEMNSGSQPVYSFTLGIE